MVVLPWSAVIKTLPVYVPGTIRGPSRHKNVDPVGWFCPALTVALQALSVLPIRTAASRFPDH